MVVAVVVVVAVAVAVVAVDGGDEGGGTVESAQAKIVSYSDNMIRFLPGQVTTAGKGAPVRCLRAIIRVPQPRLV